MSYILEALKKSQQARDLGQVPTLASAPAFAADREPVPSHSWGLLAVGLAALAVAIALYAALREAPPLPAPAAAPPTASLAPVPAPDPEPPSAAPAPSLTVQDLAELILTLSRQPAPPAAEPLATGPADPAGLGDEAALDAELERELQRQLAAADPGAPASAPAPAPEPVPDPPDRAAVPPDLLQDIESFKQQVRRERGVPPPPQRQRTVKIAGDPTRLRLTPQQQSQLPGYLMTVHVYDPEPAKRFVLINALRYGEGEETREGLRVERILPEGAVLSYLGNPFFVAR